MPEIHQIKLLANEEEFAECLENIRSYYDFMIRTILFSSLYPMEKKLLASAG